MKIVLQQNFNPGQGDCRSACLASLLELPLSKVPNFRALAANQPADFDEITNNYLERFNLMLLRIPKRDSEGIEIDFPFHPSIPEGTLCIASGKSPRGQHGHAVVGKITGGMNFELVHDPHPDQTGIDEIWTLDFLVVRNPAAIIKRIN